MEDDSSSSATGPGSNSVVPGTVSIRMPSTVMVKARSAVPPTLTARTTTVNVPAAVGAPQRVSAAPQAPVPSASNSRPGGSPLTL